MQLFCCALVCMRVPLIRDLSLTLSSAMSERQPICLLGCVFRWRVILFFPMCAFQILLCWAHGSQQSICKFNPVPSFWRKRSANYILAWSRLRHSYFINWKNAHRNVYSLQHLHWLIKLYIRVYLCLYLSSFCRFCRHIRQPFYSISFCFYKSFSSLELF